MERCEHGPRPIGPFDRVRLTAHDREISSGVADDLHQLGVGEPSVGVQDGLFQSRWSQELFKIIRVVDCEYHTCPGRTYPLNPPCEKSPMQTYQQIRGLDGFERSLAGTDRRNAYCARESPGEEDDMS